MRRPEEKIIPNEKVYDLSARLKSQGKRIISTNGCFDILHVGHVQYLASAREMGDVLVVGVNSDDSVRAIKGQNRPIQNENARALQVAGLESVDFVVIFSEKIPAEFLEKLKPHVHIKGGDYRPEELPEREIVERFGGEIRIVPLVEGFSTTRLIKQMA